MFIFEFVKLMMFNMVGFLIIIGNLFVSFGNF